MNLQGNGLVELIDDKPGRKGEFFCMDLVIYLSDEIDECGDTSWEFWHKRFMQAKAGQCAYREKCRRYKRTVAKIGKRPLQLELAFREAKR